jgi:hypothetical protein
MNPGFEIISKAGEPTSSVWVARTAKPASRPWVFRSLLCLTPMTWGRWPSLYMINIREWIVAGDPSTPEKAERRPVPSMPRSPSRSFPPGHFRGDDETSFHHLGCVSRPGLFLTQ